MPNGHPIRRDFQRHRSDEVPSRIQKEPRLADTSSIAPWNREAQKFGDCRVFSLRPRALLLPITSLESTIAAEKLTNG
jgi:hypothetical protein